MFEINDDEKKQNLKTRIKKKKRKNQNEIEGKQMETKSLNNFTFLESKQITLAHTSEDAFQTYINLNVEHLNHSNANI